MPTKSRQRSHFYILRDAIALLCYKFLEGDRTTEPRVTRVRSRIIIGSNLFSIIALDRSVRTGGVGAVPPCRGGTPAPRPKPIGYSYCLGNKIECNL